MTGRPPLAAIHPGFTVAQVLAGWPDTVRVFLRRGLACVGCVMAPHETLAEVARVYGFGVEALVEDLEEVIRNSPETGC